MPCVVEVRGSMVRVEEVVSSFFNGFFSILSCLNIPVMLNVPYEQ